MRNYATEGLDLAFRMRGVVDSRLPVDFDYLQQLEELCLREAQKARGKKVDWETELQALFVAALRSDPLRWEVTMFGGAVVEVHHSPMGGHRGQREGADLKRAGARAGWPDLDVRILTTGGVPRSLLLEVKAPGGRASTAQKEMLKRLRLAGFDARVVTGLVEMVNAVIKELQC